MNELRVNPTDGDHCDGCALRSSRREFLRDASVAAAALIGLGLSPAAAFAGPIRSIEPLAAARSTRSYPIPARDGVEIDRANDLILARAQNAVYAFSLACPHQNTVLKWDTKAGRFECPKHHSRYTADGTFIEGRATRGLDRFKISRDGNTVVVDLDVLYEQDKKKMEWNAAIVRLS